MSTAEEVSQSRSAVERWQALVEAERLHVERIRGEYPAPQERWTPSRAQAFRADPRRTGDPDLDLVSRFVAPHHTLLDVGAGAGRLALPLELRCQHVIAVEPSPNMASILKEEAAKAGINNVTLVDARWQDAEVSATDVALCFNVLNFVPDIEAFLSKLVANTRELVLIALQVDPPLAGVYPFWRHVHGQERPPTPSLGDLLDVLWAMRIYPNLEMLPSRPRSYKDKDTARQQLQEQLFVMAGSPQGQLLEAALDQLLEDVDGTLQVVGVPPTQTALLSWQRV